MIYGNRFKPLYTKESNESLDDLFFESVSESFAFATNNYVSDSYLFHYFDEDTSLLESSIADWFHNIFEAIKKAIMGFIDSIKKIFSKITGIVNDKILDEMAKFAKNEKTEAENQNNVFRNWIDYSKVAVDLKSGSINLQDYSILNDFSKTDLTNSNKSYEDIENASNKIKENEEHDLNCVYKSVVGDTFYKKFSDNDGSAENIIKAINIYNSDDMKNKYASDITFNTLDSKIDNYIYGSNYCMFNKNDEDQYKKDIDSLKAFAKNIDEIETATKYLYSSNEMDDKKVKAFAHLVGNMAQIQRKLISGIQNTKSVLHRSQGKNLVAEKIQIKEMVRMFKPKTYEKFFNSKEAENKTNDEPNAATA